MFKNKEFSHLDFNFPILFSAFSQKPYFHYDSEAGYPYDIESYRVNGKLHREDGPALIKHSRYSVEYCWYLNGIIHRVGGPASITYNYYNVVMDEAWIVNGKYHRLDGPAVIAYENGKAVQKLYYIKGRDLNKDEWFESLSLSQKAKLVWEWDEI